MVYKRYWLPVLAALDLPHSRWHDLRHAFAVTSLAGEHYREALNPACHAVGVTKASAGKPYPTA